jgi:hypothetical protein
LDPFFLHTKCCLGILHTTLLPYFSGYQKTEKCFKMFQNGHKIPKIAIKLPNGHENQTKLPKFSIPNPSKVYHNRHFGMKICSLATT